MKLVQLLFLLGGASAKLVTTCYQDNCARAVTGTYQNLQSTHKQDCSSFFRATVYPSTVTKTHTKTIYPFTATSTVTTSTVSQTSTIYPFTSTSISTTTTVTESTTYSTTVVTGAAQTVTTITGTTTAQITQAPQQKRANAAGPPPGTVFPSILPAYASCCSGTSEYSSACSCFGVQKKTTTAHTPTTTVTTTVSATTTVTTKVGATSTATLSETTTITLDAAATTTASFVATSSVTSTTTVDVEYTATANALCQNGKFVDGTSTSCSQAGCLTFNLRIEGESDTVYEGLITTGPEQVTTPSGGTHECDGTNNDANPNASGTPTTGLSDAGGLCGFSFDGTYDASFQDYFITSIGGTTETSTQFWGLLVNYQFTPVGGCQSEPAAGSDVLWAFDAFNAAYFLEVNPDTASTTVGQTLTFNVKDGMSGNPIAGASFAGGTSDANGNVVFTATAPGTYRYKATAASSIRSNVVIINVSA